mmetsp:Transcript_27283/g.71917  ORF Transcript_27283/g.71917 Transcript_27283/m.71917 type:complete len:209 (+) Transcript_27283:464-1090(+)
MTMVFAFASQANWCRCSMSSKILSGDASVRMSLVPARMGIKSKDPPCRSSLTSRWVICDVVSPGTPAFTMVGRAPNCFSRCFKRVEYGTAPFPLMYPAVRLSPRHNMERNVLTFAPELSGSLTFGTPRRSLSDGRLSAGVSGDNMPEPKGGPRADPVRTGDSARGGADCGLRGDSGALTIVSTIVSTLRLERERVSAKSFEGQTIARD